MLAILVPLYKRTEEVKNLIQSWRENNAGMSELFFAVDTDDASKQVFLEITQGFKVVEGKWSGVCEKLQDMYATFKDPKFTAYHASADDITYSKEFDKEILEDVDYCQAKMGHRCWILYGQDKVHNQQLCTHWIATREYIDAVGYFTPRGYMKHCQTDGTFWRTGMMIGILRYLPWVTTHHHSWANNERPKDALFEEAYRKEQLDSDSHMFELWVAEHLTRNCNNIILSIREQQNAKKA